MANRNRNRMTLNTVGYTPAVFNAIEYQPLVQDYSGLERSFARNEERRKNLKEQESAIDVALGKIESQLYNNTEMQTWFSDYKNKIKEDIKAAAEIGDYAGALNTAIRTAGNIMQDSQLINRMKASAEFQDKINEVHKMRLDGQISKDTEDWWLENNQFKYEDTKDTEGNIVDHTTYYTLATPVPDINIPKLTKTAFDLITARQTDTKTINADGTGTAKNEKWVTKKQIEDNLTQILDEVPGAKDGMLQEYNKTIYKYEKLKEALHNAKSEQEKSLIQEQMKNLHITNQGSVMRFESFCLDRITRNAIAQNLAYRYESEIIDNKPKTTEGNDGDGGDDNSGGDNLTPMPVPGDSQSGKNNHSYDNDKLKRGIQAADSIASGASGGTTSGKISTTE